MVENMKPKLGLRERIAQAKSTDEILILTGESQLYIHASEHTRRRWRNTARTRLRQLGSKEQPAPATA